MHAYLWFWSFITKKNLPSSKHVHSNMLLFFMLPFSNCSQYYKEAHTLQINSSVLILFLIGKVITGFTRTLTLSLFEVHPKVAPEHHIGYRSISWTDSYSADSTQTDKVMLKCVRWVNKLDLYIYVFYSLGFIFQSNKYSFNLTFLKPREGHQLLLCR